MRVRLLCSRVDSYGQVFRSGSTVELERGEALTLIERGSAERDPAGPPIERAVDDREIETATTTKKARARRRSRAKTTTKKKG